MRTTSHHIYVHSTFIILALVTSLSVSSCKKSQSEPSQAEAVQLTPAKQPSYEQRLVIPIEGRPLYYERALEDKDLHRRTLRELSLMRNTIYARAGQPFVKPWLRDYFQAQSWYQAKERYDPRKLTKVDHDNAVKIGKKEHSLDDYKLGERLNAVLKDPKSTTEVNGVKVPTDEALLELRLLSIRLGRWVFDDDGFPWAQQAESFPAELRNPLEDPSLLDKKLHPSQLKTLSMRDLRLLRNTIFARRGRPFKSNILKEYFSDMWWYEENETYSDSSLSDVDKFNIYTIGVSEKTRGGAMDDERHQEIDYLSAIAELEKEIAETEEYSEHPQDYFRCSTVCYLKQEYACKTSNDKDLDACEQAAEEAYNACQGRCDEEHADYLNSGA